MVLVDNLAVVLLECGGFLLLGSRRRKLVFQALEWLDLTDPCLN